MLYRNRLVLFPMIVFTGFLFLLTFSIPAGAQNPNSEQWGRTGGEMILSGNHNFTTSWTSDSNSRQKGLYWSGSFYDAPDKRQYTPWENAVKNSVAPNKGQITVRGPGTIGLFQRTKGGAGIVMRNTETKSSFAPWTNSLNWRNDKWNGTVKNFNPQTQFWGFIPANSVVTLDIEALMRSYNNMMNTGEFAFFAPQEVTYEIWFFQGEGGR